MSDSPARAAIEFRLFGVAESPVARSSVLHQIYRSHWAGLCSYIERTFGTGPPEPEDVAQEVFTRFAALPDAQVIANPSAFLYRSARNLVFDHYRKHKVRAQFAAGLAADFKTGLVTDVHGENVLSAREHLTIVEAVVRRMEPKRRTVFLLKHIEDLSATEIARRTGIPNPTVRRYLAQALVQCVEAVRIADSERRHGVKAK